MLRSAALALIGLAAAAAAPMPAATASAPAMTPLPVARPATNPAIVQRFVDHMRTLITMGRLPDGTPMTAETTEERARPILPPALAQRVFDRGLLSGNMEACNGNWRQMSFDPLYAELAARGDLTPKQIGFAVLLHDAAREQGGHVPDEECTPEFEAGLVSAAQAERNARLP